MAFFLKTEYATPILQRRISPMLKTHGRRSSCQPKNAYRRLRVENPGLRFCAPS